jgi:hypothetical protein
MRSCNTKFAVSYNHGTTNAAQKKNLYMALSTFSHVTFTYAGASGLI